MCAGCVNNLKLSTFHCFHWTQVGQDTSYCKENIENSVIINSSISRWKVVMFLSRWELLEQLRLRTAPLVFPEALRWQIDLKRFCFIPSITWDSLAAWTQITLGSLSFQRLGFYRTSSMEPLQFQNKLVKLQKYFADYETTPDFPSAVPWYSSIHLHFHYVARIKYIILQLNLVPS